MSRQFLIIAAVLAFAACAAPIAKKISAPAAEVPMPSAAYITEVRVLLHQPHEELTIKVSGPFSFTDLADNKKYKSPKSGSFKIVKSANNLQIGSLRTPKGAMIGLNNNSDYFDIGGVHYHGPLLATFSTAGELNIIEKIDLEEYLLGVLPYEMSHSWPLEALKAQAVAARTFTLKTMQDTRNKDFDLYSDVRSQMYKGTVKTYDSIKKAVGATKGEVLKYKGEMFHTYYHANCGGHTNGDGIKPLSGAKCGYCKDSASYTWAKTLPKESVNNYLKKNNIKGEIKKIEVGKTLTGGRASTLILTTTKEKKEVSCPAFRLAVGPTVLKSCYITKADGLKLQGRGYGHGKGMCQDGAKGMALDGKYYKDILAHYYPDAKITKI